MMCSAAGSPFFFFFWWNSKEWGMMKEKARGRHLSVTSSTPISLR